MSEKKASNVKKRNWAFFVYPESAPTDWVEKLQKTGVQFAISPLHDKDLLEDNSGEVKKPHYHVIAVYGTGPTTFNVVKRLTDSLNQPIPQPLDQISGYYRYLTHKDNPDKAQYNESEIRTINGFNIADFVELTKSEVNETMRRIQTLIRNDNILEYSDLMDYLFDMELNTEHDVAKSHTIYFNAYIRSRRHKQERVQATQDRRPEPLNEAEIKALEKL